ncbi:hypothetical protein L211DRAFT_835409 [Terfezia boudieri ATCC MYA-4762]|uniref:BTB domain-containing protein n=1 Tax=Terfezia boudieri ATCC MYA-4762 TaxID=1051890 RepID=A0A3N4M0Z7_9PEZI|nr:hypothetical protein L211DRAFT_835409 [Terfezia boudieri ATCC MYA-4762]
MSVSHPAGAVTGLPTTPILSLSDIHPLIPLGAKNKKSTDAAAAATPTTGETTDPMDTGTVTTPDFNHIYFESSLFKITLSDAAHDSLDIHGGKQSQLQAKDDLKTTIDSGPYAEGGGSVFYIHKALLASLSPELRKHTDNQMREGLRGEMLLGEVDRQTMQRFLQWAYRGEYTVTTPPNSPPTTDLLEHIKLYVFSDRFNILPLQNLSFIHILTLLPNLQLRLQVNHQDDMLILLRALRYSADNLPSTSDRLMTQLILTCAWALESVSILPEFAIVVHAQPEVAVAICRAARGSTDPPWTQVEVQKPAPQLKVDLAKYEGKPRKSKCAKAGCGFLGFPMLQCRRCKMMWEDARTGYPEHDWKWDRCRGCGREETSGSLFEVCPVCGEGEGLKWF